MKFWILEPRSNLAEDDDPWSMPYDKTHKFLVMADDENSARMVADMEAGDENRSGKRPWLHEEYTTCVELNVDNFEPNSVVVESYIPN